MMNNEQLTATIEKLLLEYDGAGFTPPEIPKWLALIHEERGEAAKEAGAAAGVMWESFEQEKKLHRNYVDDLHKQIKMVTEMLGGALNEVGDIDYETQKTKILLKNDVLREYFRVMKGILPPAA